MYGLIGNAKESLSPLVHYLLYAYSYRLIDIAEDLPLFMHLRAFKGINVTIPYKEKVIFYLDFLSPLASEIGAVNTVINKDNVLTGYNTDYYGLKALILKEKIEVAGKKVLILGTGGAARAACALCLHLNAKEIYLASRTPKEDEISYKDVSKHSDASLIVNATPVRDASLIDLKNFPAATVIDFNYRPLKSMLVRSAKGRKAYGGLYILVAQAAYAVNLFFNVDVTHRIDATYVKLLKKLINIVLIGLPAAGKSTLAGILKKVLAKDVISTDEMTEERLGMKIDSYLRKHCMADFRKEEANAIYDLKDKTGVIIDCGGGVVECDANMRYLKGNGIVFYIKRDLNLLKKEKLRPPYRSFAEVEELYLRRKDLYLKYADYVISNDASLGALEEKILEVYNENFNNQRA